MTTVCKNMQKVFSCIGVHYIFLIITIFVLFISQAFAQHYHRNLYSSPVFVMFNNPPFTAGLLFGILGIIGVCIFFIILWRKSNPARIKWLCLIISLSALLFFSLFRVLSHLTFEIVQLLW